MIHNTPFGETQFFHTKFIKLTYSCETQTTGWCKNGNTCVYITQNKLSKWSIKNEAVNMCARPLPTNHSLGQGSRPSSNSHIHLRGESGDCFEGRAFVFLCLPAFSTLLLFFCFLPSFSSKACRCVAMRKKTGSRPPALVSMERRARKTKTSELYKHHSRKTAARTTHRGCK